MKFVRLEIEHYGIHSGLELEFEPAGDAGFHLVFGPNEAGKSTLLALFRDVLFGFQHKHHPYDFGDRKGELAATATVELADGSRLCFRRRKGQKNTVTGEVLSGPDSAQKIDDDALTRVLGHASAELFRSVFAFSLTELSRGEQALVDANLSEALYGGSLGSLGSFSALSDSLGAEADALFTPQGRKKTINELLARIRDDTRALRELSVRPRDYSELRRRSTELDAASKSAHGTIAHLRQESGRLDRLQRALPKARRAAAASDELNALDLPDGLPFGARAELERAKERLAEIEAERESLEAELAETRAKKERIERNPDLVLREAEVRSLNQEIAQVRSVRQDLPRLEVDAARVETELSAVFDRLPATPRSNVRDGENSEGGIERRKSSDILRRRPEVQSLAEESTTLERGLTALEAQRPELERQVRESEERWERLETTERSSRLAALVNRGSAHLADVTVAEELSDSVRRLGGEVRFLGERIARAVDCEPADLDDARVPLAGAVRSHLARFDAEKAELALAERRHEDARRELISREERRDLFRAQEEIPDREELLRRRTRRDEGWRLIRRKYIRDGQLDWIDDAGDVSREEIAAWMGDERRPVASQFELELEHCDRLADERQRRAELVAQSEQLAAEAERQREQVEESARAAGERREKLEALDEEWRSLWCDCPFAPLAPQAMLEWLDDHRSFDEKRGDLALAREQLAAVEARVESFRRELREVLARDREDGDASDELLAEARARAQEEERAASERRELEVRLPEERARLRELLGDLEAAAARKTDWESRWRQLLVEVGFPEDWSVAAATETLADLAAADGRTRELAGLRERIGQMRSALADFETRARASLGDDPASSLPTEDAVAELHRKISEAKTAEQAFAALGEEESATERRLERTREQVDRANERIASLHRAAGTTTEAELLAVIERAERRESLVREVDALEREMATIGAGDDERAFREELLRIDAAEIEARSLRTSEELQRETADYERTLEEAAVVRKELADLDSKSDAVERAQKLESHRGELTSAVDRWCALVFARATLRRSLARFESEHQPALLEDVARLFARMTLGEYVGVERRLDAEGTLLVREKTGGTKEPAQLSTGTREQLYLAIRLAYVLHYSAKSEPLPVIMDDVLVNFDDERARSTLAVIAEVARTAQVIFLTCHESRVRAAGEVLAGLKPIALHEGVRREIAAK